MPGVVIVGGGISGLSAAYYLAKGGAASTILESRPRLGGVIQTDHVEGCIIEAGPDSFLSAKPAALELIRELGLAGEVIGSNDHLRKTYVRKARPPDPPARRPDDDGANQDPAAGDHRTGGLGNQGAHGHGAAARAQTAAGRRIGGRVHRGALRDGGGGLPGRAAALRHLRRRSRRTQRAQRAAALRASWRNATAASRAACWRSAPRRARNGAAPRLCSARSKAGSGKWWMPPQPPFTGTRRSGRRAREAIERTADGVPHPRGRRLAGDRGTWWWPAKRTAPRSCWRPSMHAWRSCSAQMPYSSSMTVALGFDAADFAGPAGRLRLPGPQERAAPPGGLHVGGHEVFAPRAGGQDRGALLHRAARRLPALGGIGRNADRRGCQRAARDRRRRRRAALHAHLPLAALHGAAVPWATPRGWRRSRRGWRRFPVCTWPATPITASASPIASGSAARRRVAFWEPPDWRRGGFPRALAKAAKPTFEQSGRKTDLRSC